MQTYNTLLKACVYDPNKYQTYIEWYLNIYELLQFLQYKKNNFIGYVHNKNKK